MLRLLLTLHPERTLPRQRFLELIRSKLEGSAAVLFGNLDGPGACGGTTASAPQRVEAARGCGDWTNEQRHEKKGEELRRI